MQHEYSHCERNVQLEVINMWQIDPGADQVVPDLSQGHGLPNRHNCVNFIRAGQCFGLKWTCVK